MKNKLEAVALAYEAALEPEKWPEALQQIAQVATAKGVCLTLIDSNSHGDFCFKGVSSYYVREEFNDFSAVHAEFESTVWVRALKFFKSRDEYTIASDMDILGADTRLEELPSFKDFSQRFGAFRRSALILNHRAPWIDGMGLQYDNAFAEIPPKAHENIAAIAPYLSRAVSLIRPVQVLEAEHQVLLDALNRIAIGVAVVTADGAIVLKNEAFEHVLDTGAIYLDGLRRIRIPEPSLEAAVLDSIRGAAKTGLGEMLDAGRFVSLPVKGRANPISFEISPLGRNGSNSPRKGWSILFAVDPDWRLVKNPARLGQSYELTQAEIDVCSLVLDGHSNREIADIRDCGLETVKSHVSSLLAKTWTKNRTELARLAAVAELPLIEAARAGD